MVPPPSTQKSSTSFESLGIPSWLANQLRDKSKAFKFSTPLPVQTAVIPFACRAFSSWLLHCDVGLSSPTGSGKTLCYCLPMIKAIEAQKARFGNNSNNNNDRHIRGVIVVPTAILAEQVFDVLQGLLSSTTSSSSGMVMNVGTLFRAADDGTDLYYTHQTSSSTRYFGLVDILIATPQKLCSWIERLADEDEEEDMKKKTSNNNNKNNNTSSRNPNNNNNNNRKLVDVFGRTQVVILDEADDLLATSGYFTSMSGRIVDALQDAVTEVGETVLHKMLCSATLTARISKVSDVKLQNAKYFSLDAIGQDLSSSAAVTAGTAIPTGATTTTIVRQKFPLPSSLSEHLVIVRDDSKRHVTLLNTVRFALDELQQKNTKQKQDENSSSSAAAKTSKKVKQDGSDNEDEDDEDDGEQEGITNAKQQQTAWKSTGSSVIVFCQTAEIARVMGHFLSFAGIDALELTTLTSDAERRQAALAVAAAKSSEQKVVVASDALMRGIDLPGVGAVIMYDPPTTLQQYVHRVGRTARAGAVGHSYVLLSKNGPSGTEEDGQVAHFRSFDALLLRSGKVSNLVKLRELNDDEVKKADELLRRTRNKLNGVVVVAAAENEVGTAATVNNNSKAINQQAQSQQQQQQQRRRERL